MSNATAVTTDKFDEEVLKSPIPVLVDFWAIWCGPCKAIAPHVDAIADELAGKLKVMKVDVDSERDIAERYGIMGIPALLLFKGGEVVTQVVGAQPKDSILKAIQPHL